MRARIHDLDYGIYRIVRLKRRFIDGDGDNGLCATVKVSAAAGTQGGAALAGAAP
jgi:hypothetical protein